MVDLNVPQDIKEEAQAFLLPLAWQFVIDDTEPKSETSEQTSTINEDGTGCFL